MDNKKYRPEDFEGWEPVEVADVITDWRNNELALADDAFDLLNAIEPFLRNLGTD